MTTYNVPDSPKMLREALCAAQTAVGQMPWSDDYKARVIGHLQGLVNECDRHRPVGPDGKHGNLHTDTCGC